MKLTIIIKVTFFILIMFACTNQDELDSPKVIGSVKHENNHSKNDDQEKKIIIDSSITSVINFISGNLDLNEFEDSLIYKEYQQWGKNNSKKFENMRINRLEKIGDWNKNNIANLSGDKSAFTFYPLSGGDFIHMSYLFPNASNYLMLALEPIGNVPVLNDKRTASDVDYLFKVDQVLRNIYNQSYFVTKNMDDDMRREGIVDGVLPLILWGMGKTDHSVLSLKYFDIDSLGQKTEVRNLEKPTGVRIEFIKNGSTTIKSLEYLSVNIRNRSLINRPETLKYLQNAVPNNCNSFIKSASYVLHYSTFSMMRDFIISKTRYHLQDDTGIPYKYFDTSFNVSLFGKYVTPIEDFSENLFQKDLDIAYSDSSKFKGELPFSMGYHWWGSKDQNQMIFSKFK